MRNFAPGSLATLCLTVAAAIAPLSDARAWGSIGHAVIADIAEAHLTPAAAAKLKALLATEGQQHLDAIAAWADDIGPARPETGKWHYVDIPLAASGYDRARDCPGDACVVEKIPHFAKVLADASQPIAARVEALKWVVHLVGDIEQPLHAADNHDKGGNQVLLTYFGQPTNLHLLWDVALPERGLNLTTTGRPHYAFDHDKVRAAALALDGEITAAERAEWAPPGLSSDLEASAAGWADQSHRLARDVAYGLLPAVRAGDWDAAYQRAAWPAARTQLERGGIRLAELLNETLR